MSSTAVRYAVDRIPWRREHTAAIVLPVPMHEDQLSLPPEAVTSLIYGQLPQWAGQPIVPVESTGTVNAIFRIGETLAARFPLRKADPAELHAVLRDEAAAARELSHHTTFPIPEPIAIGRPGAGYPLPWSVTTWLPGRTAFEKDVSASTAFAHDLATFIAQVRAIDVRGRRFRGGGRGGDLRSHDNWMELCFERSAHLLEVHRLRRLWNRLRDLPRNSGDLMNHGDLTPGNLLVSDGRLAGVLDVGGLGAADPALDLVAAWHLLEAGPRRALRTDLHSDDLEWERGKAWAFQQAMGAVWYYETSNPSMSEMGRRTLDRILADEPD